MEAVTYHFNALSRFFISIFFKTYRENWYNGYDTETQEGGIYFDFMGHKILLGVYYKEIYD
jgi:hypothetical protein